MCTYFLSWSAGPSVQDHPVVQTPIIHKPGACIVDLTQHVLYDMRPTDEIVMDVLSTWKRRGTIFQAARFMHPYYHHHATLHEGIHASVSISFQRVKR